MDERGSELVDFDLFQMFEWCVRVRVSIVCSMCLCYGSFEKEDEDEQRRRAPRTLRLRLSLHQKGSNVQCDIVAVTCTSSFTCVTDEREATQPKQEPQLFCVKLISNEPFVPYRYLLNETK